MDSMLVVGMAFAVLALLVLMIRRYPLGGRGGGDVGVWNGGGSCDSNGGGDGGCDGGGGD